MFTRPQRELSRALMLSRAHMLHDVHKTPTQSSHAWMPNAWDGKRSASVNMYMLRATISGCRPAEQDLPRECGLHHREDRGD